MLLQYGLHVEAITAHPKIFDGDFIKSRPSVDQVRNRIVNVMRTEEKEQQQAILKGSLNFMDAGGVLTPAIPSRQQIIESIDKSYPVVAAAYASAWGKDQGTYHFVVIGGYSDDKFLIYNPKSESRQKSWEGIDQVMYGIHTSTAFDYDNGSILIVSKN